MKRALSAMRQNRLSEAKRGDDTMPFDLVDRKILSALRATVGSPRANWPRRYPYSP